MWRYVLAALLFLIGALEMLLALNKPMRDEIMKGSPIQSTRVTPLFLSIAGASAFVMAMVLLFFNRLL